MDFNTYPSLACEFYSSIARGLDDVGYTMKGVSFFVDSREIGIDLAPSLSKHCSPMPIQSQGCIESDFGET